MNGDTDPAAKLIGRKRRELRAGDRVILRHDDGYEELRTVAISPMRIKLHDGPRWVLYLDGCSGWFNLWRVRPAP